MKRGQQNCVFLPVPSLRNIRKHQEVAEGRPSAGGHRRTPDRLDADKAAEVGRFQRRGKGRVQVHGCGGNSKRHLFLSAVPMFVRSLSW